MTLAAEMLVNYPYSLLIMRWIHWMRQSKTDFTLRPVSLFLFSSASWCHCKDSVCPSLAWLMEDATLNARSEGKVLRISYDLWLILDRLDTWRKCVQMHWERTERGRPAGATGCFVLHLRRFFFLLLLPISSLSFSVFLFIHKWMRLGCFFVQNVSWTIQLHSQE